MSIAMIPPMQVNKSLATLDNFRSQTPAQNPRRNRALRCIICTVCILAVGALAAGGAIVVREYVLSRAYSSATCRVVNVTYAENAAECSFCEGSVEKGGGDATAHSCVTVRYPCARVVVDFVVEDGRRVGKGVLYDDTIQAGDEAGCSFSVCHKTERQNSEDVQRYVSQFWEGRTFRCFYDTETLDNAIANKVYTQSDVIHCLLWPLVVIAVCTLLFIYVELSSRGLVRLPCGTSDKRSVAHVALSPKPTSSGSASPH